MKKYFIFGLMVAIVPNLCLGASTRYTQLVREKQRKMEELEKCMGATKGLKIAGVSTLGLTAVGVAGNIAEAKKRNEYQADIDSVPTKMANVQKEIDETNNEINKLDEKKKEKEEAIALYQANCSKTGGNINKNGICICPNNNPSGNTGFCEKIIEVMSVQPNVDGQVLTDVATSNDTYTWNPVAIDDKQTKYKYLDTSAVNLDIDCNLKQAVFSHGIYLYGSDANCDDERSQNGCPISYSTGANGNCIDIAGNQDCHRCREILERASACQDELDDYCKKNGIDRAKRAEQAFHAGIDN